MFAFGVGGFFVVFGFGGGVGFCCCCLLLLFLMFNMLFLESVLERTGEFLSSHIHTKTLL